MLLHQLEQSMNREFRWHEYSISCVFPRVTSGHEFKSVGLTVRTLQGAPAAQPLLSAMPWCPSFSTGKKAKKEAEKDQLEQIIEKQRQRTVQNSLTLKFESGRKLRGATWTDSEGHVIYRFEKVKPRPAELKDRNGAVIASIKWRKCGPSMVGYHGQDIKARDWIPETVDAQYIHSLSPIHPV